VYFVANLALFSDFAKYFGGLYEKNVKRQKKATKSLFFNKKTLPLHFRTN